MVVFRTPSALHQTSDYQKFVAQHPTITNNKEILDKDLARWNWPTAMHAPDVAHIAPALCVLEQTIMCWTAVHCNCVSSIINTSLHVANNNVGNVSLHLDHNCALLFGSEKCNCCFT